MKNLMTLALLALHCTGAAGAALPENDSVLRKLQDVQAYAVLATSDPFFLYGIDLPQSLGNGHTVQRIFKGDAGYLRVQGSDSQNAWDISLDGERLYQTQYALDPGTAQLAMIHKGKKLVILDSTRRTRVECSGPSSSSLSSVIFSKGQPIVSASGYEAGRNALEVFRALREGPENCRLERITLIPGAESWSSRIFDWNGTIGMAIDQFEGVPYRSPRSVKVVSIDQAGSILSERNLSGYELDSPFGGDIHPSPSANEEGVLLLLQDRQDSELRQDLYLLPSSGLLKRIARNVLHAVWTKDRKVLMNRGTHALSSELVLLSGENYQVEAKLNQPQGFKRSFVLHQDDVFYLNDFRGQQNEAYHSPLKGTTAAKPLHLRPKLDPGRAVLPATTEVSYPSGTHRVASMLRLPKGQCRASEKHPVLVYLHGGAYSSVPSGHRMIQTIGESAAGVELLFPNAGWIVLEANYYGDEYMGGEYRRGTDRKVERNLYTETLRDIHSAGLYARSLPCADPARIYLMGHSHGCIVASLYSTAPEFEASSPYRGFILKSGHSSEAEMIHFLDLQNPSEKTLDAVVPARRVKQVMKKPIYTMMGKIEGSYETGVEFARLLSENSEQITSWFPEGGQHVFSRPLEIELVNRVRAWDASLTSSGSR